MVVSYTKDELYRIGNQILVRTLIARAVAHRANYVEPRVAQFLDMVDRSGYPKPQLDLSKVKSHNELERELING